MKRSPHLNAFASRGVLCAAIALVVAAPLLFVLAHGAPWSFWVPLAMLLLGVIGMGLCYSALRMALAGCEARNGQLRADINNERARGEALAAEARSSKAEAECVKAEAESAIEEAEHIKDEAERVKAVADDRCRKVDAHCTALTADLAATRRELTALRAEAEKTSGSSLDRHERTIAAMLTFANECVLEKDRYRKGLLRLSVANKREELHHRLSASDLEADAANLYRHFDTAFIALYPDFITRFNELLDPADRLALRPDGTMPTELRAIALMRLGISDSKTIAQLLNISVATVYNYRSRYKARLAPDASLEAAIRAL